MSHYAEIKLKMSGDAEAIIRALLDIGAGRWVRAQIEVHAERQNLVGYQGDTRTQKAHIIIRRKFVGGAANDIGFEKKVDGSWVAHISDYDAHSYDANWQKRLLSKWAVQRTGLEAEKRGYKWSVEYATEGAKQFAYVRVVRG